MTSNYDLLQSLGHYITGHVMLLSYTAEQASFVSGDVDTGANTIALSGVTYVVGTRVRITGLPDFNANRFYFSLSSASPYQFSETVGGSPVNITTASDGNIVDAEPVEQAQAGEARQCQTMADAVRYELSTYQGQATRPAITYAGLDIVEGKATLPYADNEVNVSNVGGAADLSFSYALLIKNGTATPSNTLGDVQAGVKYAAIQTIPINSSRDIQFQITSENG